MTSKKFLRNIKPCLTNNSCIIGKENNGNLISNELELVELFNEHSITITETSSSKKSLSLGNSLMHLNVKRQLEKLFLYVVIIRAFEK